MTRAILSLLLILLLSCAGCIATPLAPVTPGPASALPRHVRVQLTEKGIRIVRAVPFEEYVQAAAISEFAPPAGDLATVGRMLEIQTIIGRTYAVSHLARHAREGFDLCPTTHCQLFEPGRLRTSRWAEASSEAVARTAGLILTFDRQPIQALFHADCGGHTSSSSAVWGGLDRPYLIARPDEGAAREAHAAWRYEASAEALTAALGLTGDLIAVEILDRDDGGRAAQIKIESRPRKGRGVTTSAQLRGDEFRQRLARAFGPRALRSTRFEVRRMNGTFIFSGRGFGHGVGLCQAGALARLRAGAKPVDVMRHYYPGTVLAPGLGVRGSGFTSGS